MTAGPRCGPKMGFGCWPWLAVIKTLLLVVGGALIVPGMQFQCYC